jgi:septal ring factor EnvC (AmiA/AmiB activator)
MLRISQLAAALAVCSAVVSFSTAVFAAPAHTTITMTTAAPKAGPGHQPRRVDPAVKVVKDMKEIRQDRREIRADRRELRKDVVELRKDQAQLLKDLKAGNLQGVKKGLKEIQQDRKEIAQDRRELRKDVIELRKDKAQLAKDVSGFLR